MVQNNRVIKVNRDCWNIFQNGKVVKGIINNSFKAKSMPAVGDFVVSEDIGDNKVLILDIVERKNELAKDYNGYNCKFSNIMNKGKQIVATNIDKIFIVTSLNNDFNIGKIERFVILADIENSEKYIVLSKADICENSEKYIDELKSRFPNIGVILTSGKTGEGLQNLLNVWKEGETAVFIGSSGVGKSTLVNSLMGEEITKTNAIRERDDKGRHTTSASTLFETNNRFIIDTPGVREVGLSSISQEELAEVFAQIEELSKNCKKYKCTHKIEEGCAVKKAVEEGIIDKKILERYIKLQKEAQKKKHNKKEKLFKDILKQKYNKKFKRNNDRYGDDY